MTETLRRILEEDVYPDRWDSPEDRLRKCAQYKLNQLYVAYAENQVITRDEYDTGLMCVYERLEADLQELHNE